MAYCITHQDYPLRGRTSADGVIHAVRKGHIWARKKEDMEDLFPACRRYSRDVKVMEEPNDTTITCKNCLRELGDRREISVKYAVKTAEGLYKRGYDSKGLTGQIADAKLFQVLKVAVAWAGYKVYFNERGEEVGYDEARKTMHYKTREQLAKYRLKNGERVVEVIFREGDEVDSSSLEYVVD